jgi:hypothetical protein
MGGRIEERPEIAGGDAPLGVSDVPSVPNSGLDTKEGPDIVLLRAGGSPFVNILKRSSRPLGTSIISLLALLLPTSES